MEKLSSGLRINSAKDDAAGLQISTKLSTQINGLTVAKRNANDGISMLQVAEGAQQEITNALQRMRELALQASNATYSKSDRKALNQEFLQLKNEIDHINEDTRFGDKRMFQTSSGSLIDTVERDMAKALQKTWLSESEDIIDKHFGLTGKGSLKIDFETAIWITIPLCTTIPSVYIFLILTPDAGVDDVQIALEESLVTIATIKGSRFVDPIQDSVDEWDRRLELFSVTLDEWITCQRNWMYLESILTTPDIQRLLVQSFRLIPIVEYNDVKFNW